jgi:hypothetical protein
VADIEHLDFPYKTFGERAAKFILRPVEPFIPVINRTKDKPLNEFTMAELLAWSAVAIYGIMTVTVIIQVTGNVITVLFRGPRFRR